MNILYLHGLKSKLNSEKKMLLQKYGTVFSPDILYAENSNSINDLYQEFRTKNIDVIIGSSMGGFSAYYLSKLLKIPALLFNPAFEFGETLLTIPKEITESNHLTQIVLGNLDDVIPAFQNLKYIIENIEKSDELRLHLLNNMGHRIPFKVFEKETSLFFKSI